MGRKSICILLLGCLCIGLIAGGCASRAGETIPSATDPVTEPEVQYTQALTEQTQPPTMAAEPSSEPPTEAPTELVTEPSTEPAQPRDPDEPALDPPEAPEGAGHFYDDAAFIGDSVSIMLSRYASRTGSFGSAVFLTRGSLGISNSLRGVLKVTYQGQEMAPEDALAACGAKKVFIMLGTNDIGVYGVDRTIENWDEFLRRIREKNPDIEVYIQSCAPIYPEGEKEKLNNANMDRYNQCLREFAEDKGCFFVDIAPYLKDGNNGLAKRYCSDQYVHLTYAGAEAWAKTLLAYAGSLNPGETA